MGVKDLWKVLEPRSEPRSVPLKSLQGKTLAVDLSGWIVEFRTNRNSRHLYLRLVKSRTSDLLLSSLEPNRFSTMIVVITYDLSDEWTFCLFLHTSTFIYQITIFSNLIILYLIEKGHSDFRECKKEAQIVMA